MVASDFSRIPKPPTVEPPAALVDSVILRRHDTESEEESIDGDYEHVLKGRSQSFDFSTVMTCGTMSFDDGHSHASLHEIMTVRSTEAGAFDLKLATMWLSVMEVPAHVWLAAACVYLLLHFAVRQLLLQTVSYPTSIPVVGTREEWFSSARASFRQLTHGISTLSVGYKLHSKHGRPFLLNEPSLQKEVMLPPEHIKWFSNQPDSILSSTEIRKERHAVRYLDIGVEFDTTVFFLERFINESLTKNLDKLQEPMVEEIRRNTVEVFGTSDSEWKTLNVYGGMQNIVLPAMSRVFFGVPLSRDPKFLTSFRRYVLAMGVGTLVIGQLPQTFKGLLVPIFNLPLRYYKSKTMKTLVPIVERHIQIQKISTEPEGKKEEFDLVSQSARISAKLGGIRDIADSGMLAEWILLLGFAALSSTIIQASNLLLDVLTCPTESQAYNLLHEEAARSLQCEEDWMNPAIFKRLTLCDSAIRETARYHPILIKGLTKEVVRPQGLKLPDGTHIPHGCWLGVPVLGLHNDDRFYPEPHRYDPFRYARMKQDRERSYREEQAKGKEQPLSTRDLDAGQPTSTYVGFGYGKHACQITTVIQSHDTLSRGIFLTTSVLCGLTMLTVAVLSFHNPDNFAKNLGMPLAPRTSKPTTNTTHSSGVESPSTKAADARAYLVLVSARELAYGISILVLFSLGEYKALSVLLMALGSLVGGGDALAASWYGRDANIVAQHAVPGSIAFGAGVVGWVLFG
ncbi:MAG: hypothetical protein Q9168_002634 [Polycauliona sp. 1 TL-2023]